MFKIKKKSNIQKLLSRNFIFLLTFIVGITTIIFSIIQYRTVMDNALSELSNLCTSVGDNVDLQIYQLDSITLNTINSNELRDTLDTYVNSATESDLLTHVKSKQQLSGLLTTLKGFDYSIRQLNIYSTSDMGFGVGDYLGPFTGYNNNEWYNNTVSAKGLKNISIGDLDSTGALVPGDTYFSIARTYYNTYHQTIGTIEARKYYDEVFKTAIDSSTSYSHAIYIYDCCGELVYPYEKSRSFMAQSFFDYKDNQVTKVQGKYFFTKDYIFSYHMPHSDFYTVMYVHGETFALPILKSIGIIFFTFITIYILGLFLVQIMSRSLSNPIRKIYHFLLEKGPANQYELLDMPATNIREIDKLTKNINEYIAASEQQAHSMMELTRQEVQAQMLALQSQMNPHFLYNSLACIEEMAYEGLNDQVATMVRNISSILRAIASNKDQVISIENELDLCDMYLECLSLRFGKDLTYEFDVEDKLLDYYCPKLCIQLLVENAIKSTTTIRAPWHIKIHGYISGDDWFIEVIDNGPGFDKDIDVHLRKQMDSILETGILPSLKIEGMGILNIFIRLYLLDGITFLFDFGNNENGGAFVKIGRSLNKSESQ